MGNDYDESPARGFDLAFVPKAKLFGRGKGPRLLGRFVSRVDADAVGDTWAQIGKLNTPSNEEVCVFLMGTAMAPRRELEDAIFAQRRKDAGAGRESDRHSRRHARLGRAHSGGRPGGRQESAGAAARRHVSLREPSGGSARLNPYGSNYGSD